MVKASTTEAIEALAAEIGENVYLDLANWHLYLSDAHLAWAVAEQIYPMSLEHSLDESKVVQILAKIQVSLGGGKENIPLINLIPTIALRAYVRTIPKGSIHAFSDGLKFV